MGVAAAAGWYQIKESKKEGMRIGMGTNRISVYARMKVSSFHNASLSVGGRVGDVMRK